MTRVMYDSVTPTNIPANAEMVAGYIDKTLYRWPESAWGRFPNATKVRIARDARTNDGHVLDVEDKLATPAQSPGWIKMRRAAGAIPTIYCNRSTKSAVIAACAAAGVALPLFWIATANRREEIPEGAVAAQHTLDFRPEGFPGTVDISLVEDYWPGVDPAPVYSTPDNIDQEDPMRFEAGTDVHESIFVKGKTKLYFCTADLGDAPVKITSIDFYGDTRGDIAGGNGVGGPIRNAQIDPHRPGPLPIPPNATMAQIRYTANHAFGVGLA